MRKSSRCLLMAGAVLLGVTSLDASIVPGWVLQAAAATLPTYEPDTNAVVLLDEPSISVTGPGEYNEHYRRVVKILRPEGRGEAEFEVYLPTRDKLRSVHCWTVDRSGHEFELKDKDFVERGFAAYGLYSDVRWRVGTCPAGDPGAVVALEYEVQRHWWLDQWGRSFQESIPVHEAHILLKLPSGWEYKALWGNGASVEPVKGADGSWEWTLHDLPAIDIEPMRAETRALGLRMSLVYFSPAQQTGGAGSWDALGRWESRLTADRRVPTPELSEKARQLTTGKMDFDGKVRALASFLQSDVRYVAIEIGIGGYQPHPAGDIFRARYGDCKDKATLLSTMLHEVGIDSDYVVINTHRGIALPSIPSPESFNHVILAIELRPGLNQTLYRSVIRSKSGKQYLLFDPTDSYTPLGELRGDLQSTYALLVADGGGELIRTPLLQPDSNLLARTGHFTIAPDGALAGEIVESRAGDHALRERLLLSRANEQQRSQELERRLNLSLKGFTLERAGIQDLEQLDQNLQITFKLSNPGYAQIRGPLMLVRPRVMGEKSLFLDRKPRHFPIEFDSTSRETDVYEFDLPKGYVVDDVPSPVNVDMGFASYQSKIDVEGTKLRYSREYIRREVLISPDRMEQFRKLQGIIGADENAAVVLKRVS